MAGNPFVAAIMAIAIVNGIFSAFFVVTSQVMITAIMPPLLLAGPVVIAFLASLIAATATIILAGVPAAIFERATRRTMTDAASYSIWLVTTIALSFPALVRVVAIAS